MIHTALKAIGLAIVLSPLMASNAQDLDIPEDGLVSLITREAETAEIDGTFLVAKDGQPIALASFGLANREHNVENLPETRYRIASMTKSFTAVLVMQLVEAGEIDLDATFGTYLPDYPAEYKNQITVRHMLANRSGIPHYAELPGWRDGKFRSVGSDEDFIAAFAAEPLNFEPGSEYRYSNSNYFLLGKILETITGKPYSGVLEERILSPLGMTDTGDYQSGEVVPHLASDYMRNGEEIRCEPADARYCKSGYVNMDLFQATGSLHSTVRDLLKWDQGLYGDALLSADSKAIMFDPDTPFAWVVGAIPLDDEGTTARIITYNGGINGYTSIIGRFPDSGLTIIILNNNGSGYNKLANATVSLARALLKE